MTEDPNAPRMSVPIVAAYAPPDHPRATLVLVLGILSLVCCGIFTGIPAIIIGKAALREIDASNGSIGGRGSVKAGYVCGIVSTVLTALVAVVYLGFFVLLAIGASTSGAGS